MNFFAFGRIRTALIFIAAIPLITAFINIGLQLALKDSQEKVSTTMTASVAGLTDISDMLTDLLIVQKGYIAATVNSDLSNVKQDLNALKEMQTGFQAARSLGLETQPVTEAVTLYTQTFYHILWDVRYRGVSEDLGYRGMLRSAVHEIEALLKQDREDYPEDIDLLNEMTVLMLMMRRHEKDYIIRGNKEKYFSRIKKRQKEFEQSLLKLERPAEYKKFMTRTLKHYIESFEIFADVNERLVKRKDEAQNILRTLETEIQKITTQLSERSQESVVKGQEDHESFSQISLILAGVFGVVGLGFTLLIGRRIQNGVRIFKQSMSRVQKGQLDRPVAGQDRRDEFGEMLVLLDDFRVKLQEAEHQRVLFNEQEQKAKAERRDSLLQTADQIEDSVGVSLKNVSSAASELEATAQAMAYLAVRTQEESHKAVTNAESTTASIGAVTGAVSLLTQSISDIEQHVKESSATALEAVNRAQQASGEVEALDGAAARIADVVQLIRDIAEQTNLLALNATIEAARAGEAGKGFAVVANEVKSLANQTARATNDISENIDELLTVVQATSSAMQLVKEAIERMDNLMNLVSNAVDQQTETSTAIDHHTQIAADGSQALSEMVQFTATSAAESSAASSQVQQSSQDVAAQCEALFRCIEMLLSNIRGTVASSEKP